MAGKVPLVLEGLQILHSGMLALDRLCSRCGRWTALHLQGPHCCSLGLQA